MNIFKIILLFIPVWLMYYLGNFGGFSLGKCFVLYLIGYYILSCDDIIREILKHKIIAVAVCCFAIGSYNSVLQIFILWRFF